MQLNLKRFGSSGPSLIVQHGLLGSSQNWHSAATLLGEKFQVLVPDLRNHGDSPHGRHTVQDMSADLLELLDSEQLERAIVIGHSMGGLAAMHFAFHNPERLSGLIIEDIAPEAKLSRMQFILEAMDKVDLSAVSQRKDAGQQLADTIPNKMVRQFLLQNLRRQENGNYEWRCNVPELLHFVREESYEAGAEQQFTGKTLFIGGKKSDHRLWEKEELIARHFPNYHLEIIPTAGHWVHFEATQSFVDLVENQAILF